MAPVRCATVEDPATPTVEVDLAGHDLSTLCSVELVFERRGPWLTPGCLGDRQGCSVSPLQTSTPI